MEFASNATARRKALRGAMAGLSVAALMSASVLGANAQDITFWAQPQGDLLAYQDLFDNLTSQFRDQTGINVSVEVINWSVAFNTWLTVAQGGAAPDCADMYWLHAFVGIGGGKYGPRPLTDYLDQWPTLDQDFYEGALTDVRFNNEFYGIPWRVDIRPLIYRTDLLAEAGIDHPPQTWDEIVEDGLKLTQRDANGNVSRWGFAPGTNNAAQVMLPYYWQAGGQIMSDDGKTATIDNEAMRTALKFLQDLVHVHKIASPEMFESSNDAVANFTGGQVAMIGSMGSGIGEQLARDYPEMEGKWDFAINPEGPENRDSYSGGGYWGVLQGSQNVEACVEWIKFLSTPENMQVISETTGTASPRRAVMESPYWTDADWKKQVAETLNYGHTSQHPTSVWTALASPEPGAVLYDLVYNTVIIGNDIDAEIAQAQTRLQAELDRANAR